MAADRAMWDYNPVMVNSSIVNPSKAGQGRFYKFPSESARNPARQGSFEAGVAIMKDYVIERSVFLDQRIADPLIPYPPSIIYTRPAGFPLNRIELRCSPYNGGSPFEAMKWRVGEVRDAAPGVPGIYEIEPLWETPEIGTFSNTVAVPSEYLKVGHNYRARVKMKDVNGRWSNWSLPAEFVAGDPDNSAALQQYIRPRELMYNPPAGSEWEYVEVQNVSSNVTVQLAGATFTDGIDFVFPANASLVPGEYALIVKADPTNNFAPFRQFYGIDESIRIFGPFGGSLDNSGERLTLKTASAGAVIFSFVYDDVDSWPTGADGSGYSLVLREALPANANLDDASSWRASSLINGSPGRADSAELKLDVQRTATGLSLSFAAIVGTNYRIEVCDSLLAGQWQTLQEIHNAPATVLIGQSTFGRSERFYRLVKVP
jgi:hypothetical protein